MGNEELVDMYEKRLGDAGYVSFKLARTNNRGDGMAFCFFFILFFCGKMGNFVIYVLLEESCLINLAD